MITETRAADWVAQYQSGEEKLRLGMIEEACRELQSALAAAESSKAEREGLGAIHDALGRAQFQAGRYQKSAHYFERALRLWDRPADRAATLCNAGQAYRELGEHGRAERYVREAVEIAPTEPR
ncbi:MAG: tetratricopeptide repeat protein, partial [Acidobacteria bacterium]|nr:tetratricopeptide repeat protein [Acidobacteriota bacterium]